MIKIAWTPSWPDKTAQNWSKLLKIAQAYSILLNYLQRGDVLAYAGAKVVITWHCSCRGLFFAWAYWAEAMPAATFRTLNHQVQLTRVTCHLIGCHNFNKRLIPKKKRITLCVYPALFRRVLSFQCSVFFRYSSAGDPGALGWHGPTKTHPRCCESVCFCTMAFTVW